MVFASICEHASTASFFASKSTDQICLASSEHFRKYTDWRTASRVWKGFCVIPNSAEIERVILEYREIPAVIREFYIGCGP